ncbi:MAG: hypothetical protein COB36_14560 [Alphaproteobacteria bacterium]|nr:MAG: hypothetical protein COB36_14560 [Alphaproteobacteria bacterium]
MLQKSRDQGAALPITETGYRSHFTPLGNIEPYGDAVTFVKEWLDHAGQSEDWKILQDEARQMSLF